MRENWRSSTPPRTAHGTRCGRCGWRRHIFRCRTGRCCIAARCSWSLPLCARQTEPNRWGRGGISPSAKWILPDSTLSTHGFSSKWSATPWQMSPWRMWRASFLPANYPANPAQWIPASAPSTEPTPGSPAS